MDGRRVRGTSRELDARVLRHSPTRAEDLLWNTLRGWNLAKFRRQHPVDRFILDFYCASAKLCIEVDGGVHDQQQERDAARTAYLAARSIRVIRFTNAEVLHETRTVMRRIEAVLETR